MGYGKLFILACSFLVFRSSCFVPQANAQDIKQPVVAGGFYPADKNTLSKDIDTYLDNADVKDISTKIYGIITPHAGFIYSGPVAAYSFKAIKGRQFDTVIVIGASHYVDFNGIAVGLWDFYRTPLGDIPIDKEFAKRLLNGSKLVNQNETAFEREHSVETELPFLQKVLSDFKLVTLVTGRLSMDEVREFSSTLRDLISQKNVLLVISTDLSHYQAYEQANVLDKFCIDSIKSLDLDVFSKRVNSGTAQLCGVIPVSIMMSIAKELGLKAEILRHATSGDSAGDKDKVVGYASIVFYENKGRPQEEGDKDMLNETQKKRLLEIARKTIEAYLSRRETLEFKEDDLRLSKEEGAFVTLHKTGDLRGCIGNIYGKGPLFKTIRDMSIASSTQDPRFSPVSLDELKDIEIEISVLSVPEKVSDVSNIEMGKHGVIVRRGLNSGVFLPQVATETGWTREEFLSNLCAHKAGLSPSAWKDKNTEIYKFSADVFSEKEFK